MGRLRDNPIDEIYPLILVKTGYGPGPMAWIAQTEDSWAYGECPKDAAYNLTVLLEEDDEDIPTKDC